jgi:plasmid maintenance system antidote protein VapI
MQDSRGEDRGFSWKMSSVPFTLSADFWMNLQSAYELDIAQHSPPASGQGDKADSKRTETSEPRPAA